MWYPVFVRLVGRRIYYRHYWDNIQIEADYVVAIGERPRFISVSFRNRDTFAFVVVGHAGQDHSLSHRSYNNKPDTFVDVLIHYLLYYTGTVSSLPHPSLIKYELQSYIIHEFIYTHLLFVETMVDNIDLN